MRHFVVVVVAAGLGGCPFLPDHELGDQGAPERLIAFASDFEGYRSWPHVVVGTGPIEGGHNLDAPRTVFVNALPDDDALTWPVGTVIVKEGSGQEVEGGTGTQTHAMVKRGGNFNVDGALGWEWFEIQSNGDAVVIVWRGEHPPDGEGYGCISGVCVPSSFGECNACHAGARGNDFVSSSQLQLGRFDASLLLPR